MSQTYPTILSTDKLVNSLTPLLNRDDANKSNFSGTAFPTTDLLVGMMCYRTDLGKAYILADLTPTWVELKLVIGAITAALISDGGVTGRQLLQASDASAAKALLSLVINDITNAGTFGKSFLATATSAVATALLANLTGDSGSGGTAGLVPPPAAGDAAKFKALVGSALWDNPSIRNARVASDSGFSGASSVTFALGEHCTNVALFLNSLSVNSNSYIQVATYDGSTWSSWVSVTNTLTAGNTYNLKVFFERCGATSNTTVDVHAHLSSTSIVSHIGVDFASKAAGAMVTHVKFRPSTGTIGGGSGYVNGVR